jgi:Holliday junction resolvase-like predicted endonuclease
LLKKNGIIVGFISELFGNKYAETLKELVTVLNNAGASLKKDPNKYLDLIFELKKYNQGLANNIKGTLFEFVVGHIIFLENNCNIDIGREIFENGKHEIDVFATNNQIILFAECKATKGQVTLAQVDKWLGRKIPAFRKWALKQETWQNKQLEFEYWSVNGFETDAEEKLKQSSNSATKIKISYFNGMKIRDKALKLKNKKLKEAIDNFFLKTEV